MSETQAQLETDPDERRPGGEHSPVTRNLLFARYNGGSGFCERRYSSVLEKAVAISGGAWTFPASGRPEERLTRNLYTGVV